jgi:hypothetical protein
MPYCLIYCASGVYCRSWITGVIQGLSAFISHKLCGCASISSIALKYEKQKCGQILSIVVTSLSHTVIRIGLPCHQIQYPSQIWPMYAKTFAPLRYSRPICDSRYCKLTNHIADMVDNGSYSLSHEYRKRWCLCYQAHHLACLPKCVL